MCFFQQILIRRPFLRLIQKMHIKRTMLNGDQMAVIRLANGEQMKVIKIAK